MLFREKKGIIKQTLANLITKKRSARKSKVFCIGRNKTGTNSLSFALSELGYRVGNQTDAEVLIIDWARRDFSRIIRYCKSADAFQDIPFSLDFTYQAVDQAFPGSKFILTIRRSAEEWYHSLVRFHSKWFASGRLPSEKDLANASYCQRGWLLRVQKLVYGYPKVPLYDKRIYIKHYEEHKRHVLKYFRHRSEDLLILNVAQADAYERLCRFLDMTPVRKQFPWLNRTRDGHFMSS